MSGVRVFAASRVAVKVADVAKRRRGRDLERVSASSVVRQVPVCFKEASERIQGRNGEGKRWFEAVEGGNNAKRKQEEI